MSTKTKTTKAKSKKENLAALGLPALWERFKEATGETTKSPNKKFLVRRIKEALAVRASPSRRPPRSRSARRAPARTRRRCPSPRRRSPRARFRSRAVGSRR